MARAHERNENPTVEDYRWLVEGGGRNWLQRAAESGQPTETLATRLRADLSHQQTHLVLEQLLLRSRARSKFPDASKMYFTRQLLEQSTGQPIAKYKAARFRRGAPVFDLCCGIGGDLAALARRGQVTGVDRDEVAAYLARANCRNLGLDAEVICAEAEQFSAKEAVHIDPDRRFGGRRSVQLDRHQPSRDTLGKLIEQSGEVAIKLAPATPVESFLSKAELEWIGTRRECQQLVAWFGRIARHAGRRVATVISAETTESLVGDNVEPTHSTRVDRFVVEPHASVLAAGLAGQFAANQSLRALTPKGGYLTGEAGIDSSFADCYEVIEVMAYRPKRIKSLLQQYEIGRLTVKKRGVPLDPEQVQRECLPRSRGDQTAVLMLTRIGQRATAILAKPWSTSLSPGSS